MATSAAATATPVRGWASAAAAARTSGERERVAASMAPRARSTQEQQRTPVGLRPVTQQQLEARHLRRAASAPLHGNDKPGVTVLEMARLSEVSGDDDDDDNGEWKSVESKSRWNRAHKRMGAVAVVPKRTSTAVVPTSHVVSSSYYSWATTSVTSASSAATLKPQMSKLSSVQREDSIRRHHHIRQETSSSTTMTSMRHETTVITTASSSTRISTTLQEDSLMRNTNTRGRKTEQNGSQSRSGVRSPPPVALTSESTIQRCTSLQQLLDKIELDKQDVEQQLLQSQQSTSTRRRNDQAADHERRSSIEPVKPPPPPPMKCGDKRDFFFRNLDFETRNRLQIDDVAGFSVTEHEMATKISEAILALYAANEPASLSTSPPLPNQQDVRERSSLTITDATACVGGNVISFCDYFSIVNAVECDLTRCEMLQHNLAVLKKDNAICIHASYLMVMHDLQQDVVFIDPPWGGPEYKDLAKVDLFLDDIPLYDICKMLYGRAKIVVLKVPTNFDTEKFAEHVPGKVTVRKDLNKMHLVAIDFREEKRSERGG